MREDLRWEILELRDEYNAAATPEAILAKGFDKLETMLQHAQIAPANAAFSPSATAVAEAESIVAALGRPENAGKGVISLDGRMVERLHLEQAERLLAKAAGNAGANS